MVRWEPLVVTKVKIRRMLLYINIQHPIEPSPQLANLASVLGRLNFYMEEELWLYLTIVIKLYTYWVVSSQALLDETRSKETYGLLQCQIYVAIAK